MTLGSDAFGTLVDWASSAPIDAVIVKGGANANAYVYPGESSGDTGLHTPFNGPDKYYGLSHVNFCWDDETPTPPDTPTRRTRPTPRTPRRSTSRPPDPPPAAQPPGRQPPADGGTLPETFKAGALALTGPSGCAGRTVKASVKGTEIAKVVFRLDGRKVKTTAGPGRY